MSGWRLKCLLCEATPETLREKKEAWMSDLVLMQRHVVFDHPEQEFALCDHWESSSHRELPDGRYIYALKGVDWLEAVPSALEE